MQLLELFNNVNGEMLKVLCGRQHEIQVDYAMYKGC